jgi:hypothetical protein
MRKHWKSVAFVIVAFVVLAVAGVVIGRASPPRTDGTRPLIASSNAEVADEFNRTDGTSLGQPPKAHWVVDKGEWGIRDGAAYVVSPPGDPALAVVETDGPDGVVQVTMATSVNDCGLLFRYRDTANYWALTAVPGYATWNLERVIEGNSVIVANTGLSPTKSGTVLAVRMRGDLLELFVDGKLQKQVKDTAFQTESRVGLIGRGPAVAQARWDGLLADGAPTGKPPDTVVTPP